MLSKTQEDVAKARQKAKDWALKQGIKVSEDTPWSSKADPGERFLSKYSYLGGNLN